MGKNHRGFTLVELMIVIGIIAILAGLGWTTYSTQVMRARDGKRKADLEQIRAALEMCRSDLNSYPASVPWGGALTCNGNVYLNPVPLDPKNSSPYVYTYSIAGGGNTYALCANRLEADSGNYCVNNP